MPRIALVTYDPRPEPSRDGDLPVLLRALTDAGAEAEAVHWDDEDADWASYDLAVIRSTWDYSWRAAEFTAWAERCAKATRLANPVGVVRWNADKRYLGDLAAAGVPVVPTRYLAPEDAGDAGDAGGAGGAGGAEGAGGAGGAGNGFGLPVDHEYVIKPTSGAGARYAARYTPDRHDTAVRHLARLHEEGLTAMVQPYVRSIDTGGERALQFFGGRLLHASRKRAVLAPDTAFDEDKVAHPGLEPWTPAPAELAVAERALAAVPEASGLLYARVDLVTGDDGEPLVMELELVEPNLFLFLHPGSVSRVAEAILTAATTG
ncbi:RimK family alpha-L-glutamate ligase [Streptomyces sp. NPDC059894]|uniref:ATP-grasp domain-containing protein n=1 Tax=unclassified Streptomyces TaxID=2593676 RepID=UPI0036537F37